MTPIFGQPGSLRADTESTLSIAKDAVPTNDILLQNSKVPGTALSMLGIDLLKRVRHRINGAAGVSDNDKAEILFNVLEYSPNCPKYINRRQLLPMGPNALPIVPNAKRAERTSLNEEDMEMIRFMDTLFIGTHNPGGGADVNHRGGKPGFVRVLDSNKIIWPEYRGNGMYFSSGNLECNKEAGVTMIDFENGDILQMSGFAIVDWEHTGELDGATRTITFTIRDVVRIHGATDYRWELLDYSPYNPSPFGQEGGSDNALFPVDATLAKIVEESPLVKTFRWVVPRNIAFLPGQYATFEFGRVPESGELSHIRTWTLSESSNSIKGDNTLDISVKRKEGGLLSNWLHDHAQVGLKVKLHGVQGEMTPIVFDTNNAPVAPSAILLISAGIGLTPSLAIIRGLGAFQIERKSRVTMIHVERNRRDLAFQSELLRRSNNYNTFTMTNIITSEEGRLSKERLKLLVPRPSEQTVYICGPPGFMESVNQMLVDLGVDPGRINTESFDF